MAKMKAAMAAVLVMEKEGVSQVFGVPGAAINPLYAQMAERGTISHVLARHVEGASHMAEVSPALSLATSAFASALQALPAPT